MRKQCCVKQRHWNMKNLKLSKIPTHIIQHIHSKSIDFLFNTKTFSWNMLKIPVVRYRKTLARDAHRLYG